MILDDDASLAALLERRLERVGVASVTVAVNGQDGLRHLDTFPRAPDIIFCDLNMPGI
ncbi:MAG: response regulator, partial [Chromatiales bacterium]|nr:response regulator [Chromatiales bacterium]